MQCRDGGRLCSAGMEGVYAVQGWRASMQCRDGGRLCSAGMEGQKSTSYWLGCLVDLLVGIGLAECAAAALRTHAWHHAGHP
jgi:hypothetical protein